MSLRGVIPARLWEGLGASIGPSIDEGGPANSAMSAADRRPHPTCVETTLPRNGRLVKAPALVLMQRTRIGHQPLKSIVAKDFSDSPEMFTPTFAIE